MLRINWRIYIKQEEGLVTSLENGFFSTNHKLDQQCTYQSNIEARSREHCCYGNAMSITYLECVSVALPNMQNAYTVLCCHL